MKTNRIKKKNNPRKYCNFIIIIILIIRVSHGDSCGFGHAENNNVIATWQNYCEKKIYIYYQTRVFSLGAVYLFFSRIIYD